MRAVQIDIYTTYFTCYRQSFLQAIPIIWHNRKRLEFVRVWWFTKKFRKEYSPRK